jgi:hypothetical protein
MYLRNSSHFISDGRESAVLAMRYNTWRYATLKLFRYELGTISRQDYARDTKIHAGKNTNLLSGRTTRRMYSVLEKKIRTGFVKRQVFSAPKTVQ